MTQQASRLLLVAAVLVAGLVVVRHFLVPKTFGQRGHYRAAAVDAIEKLPIRYAGREACELCHADIVAMHGKARHQSVACEVCHGPAATHTESPGDIKPPAPRTRGYCPLCHGYDPTRPTGFPQIDPATHNPVKACISCHNPHAPEPPHTPEECGACHGQIARSKAVSRHAQLQCVQCHNTPEKHKITPRLVHPEKPRTREFCGGCHAQDARSSKDIRRVDMQSHNPRYLCWQCHYPHQPEVD